MSTFKEIKALENIKVWENKVKRLYASDLLNNDDLKYLNYQFELYRLRKSYIVMISCFLWGFTYNFAYIKKLEMLKKSIIATSITALGYVYLRKKNRYHYERIIFPYFEKYYVK